MLPPQSPGLRLRKAGQHAFRSRHAPGLLEECGAPPPEGQLDMLQHFGEAAETWDKATGQVLPFPNARTRLLSQDFNRIKELKDET